MKLLIVIPVIVTLMISCSKRTESTCNLEVAAVTGTYKITAVRYRAGLSDPEIDYYYMYFTDPCQRDDIFTFNVNGSYALTDAGMVCSPPGDITGTWSLSSHTIIIDTDPTHVESFSCSGMSISESNKFIIGDKLTRVFSRQ